MSPSMVPVAAGTARRPTSPLGRRTTFSGREAAHGQAHAVRLGDALGQPPQDHADLAVGHRPAGEPLGERLAVDPLVDDVGGAAGRASGSPDALGGVVDHRERGGGQAAGGERAADPGVRGRAGGRVHADGDVAVEHAVLGPPAADDAGGGGLVRADLVQRPVAVGEADGRGCHRHCRPPLLFRSPGRLLRRRRVIPRRTGHPRSLRALIAASGSRISGTRATTRPARAAPPMTTVPISTRASEPAAPCAEQVIGHVQDKPADSAGHEPRRRPCARPVRRSPALRREPSRRRSARSPSTQPAR